MGDGATACLDLTNETQVSQAPEVAGDVADLLAPNLPYNVAAEPPSSEGSASSGRGYVDFMLGSV